MPPSDDFRTALQAGQLEEAFLLAISRATELQVTTWVAPARQDATSGPAPGRRLRTRIDLLQGDIENEVGDRFLRDRNYQELRQFHSDQVGKGSEIVAQNLESLRRLFSVMRALHATPGRAIAIEPPDETEAIYPDEFTADAEFETSLPPSADWATLPDSSPGVSSEPETWVRTAGSAAPPAVPPAPAPAPAPEPTPAELPDPWQASSRPSPPESESEPEPYASEDEPAPLDDPFAADLADDEPAPIDDDPFAADLTDEPAPVDDDPFAAAIAPELEPPEASDADDPFTVSLDDLELEPDSAVEGDNPATALDFDNLEPAPDPDVEALFRDLEIAAPAPAELVEPDSKPKPAPAPSPDSLLDEQSWDDFVAFVEAEPAATEPPTETAADAPFPDLADNADWGEWFADDEPPAASPSPPPDEHFPVAREEQWETFTPTPFDPYEPAADPAPPAPDDSDEAADPAPPAPDDSDETAFFLENFLVDESEPRDRPNSAP